MTDSQKKPHEKDLEIDVAAINDGDRPVGYMLNGLWLRIKSMPNSTPGEASYSHPLDAFEYKNGLIQRKIIE